MSGILSFDVAIEDAFVYNPDLLMFPKLSTIRGMSRLCVEKSGSQAKTLSRSTTDGYDSTDIRIPIP